MPDPAPPPPLPNSVVRRVGFTLFPPENTWRLAMIGAFFGTIFWVMILALLQVVRQPKLYQSSASLTVERGVATPMSDTSLRSAPAPGVEDVNSIVKMLISGALVQRVSDRITGDSLREFMAPYELASGEGAVTPLEVLTAHCRIEAIPQSFIIRVNYRHPNPHVAAEVANLYAECLVDLLAERRNEDYLLAVQTLKSTIKEQTARISALETAAKAPGKAPDPALNAAAESGRTGSDRELAVEQGVLEQLTARLTALRYLAALNLSPVRIMDHAVAALDGDYVSPNVVYELGIGLGLALAGAVLATLATAFARTFFGR